MASEADADKLMKKAEKKIAPSIMAMRFKPDWDEATPLFENAALQYKAQWMQLAGRQEKAMQAYEKAAHANERGGGTLWHAAKHLESAAAIAKDLSKWDAVYDYTDRASTLYVEAGKATVGAECCGKGGRLLEQSAPERASELYMRAVQLYSDDTKGSMAQEIVQRAVGLHIRSANWAGASEVLLKWAVICSACENPLALCRAYLSVVIIWLYAEDAEQAWRSYQDVLDVSTFAESGEAFAAEALLSSYALGDAALIKKRIKDHREFQAIDAQVARLAKLLPIERALPGMAAVLSQKMGGGAVVDVDEPLPATADGDVDLT